MGQWPPWIGAPSFSASPVWAHPGGEDYHACEVCHAAAISEHQSILLPIEAEEQEQEETEEVNYILALPRGLPPPDPRKNAQNIK